MQFYSTNDHNLLVSFREAVLNGIAPDGGLYMPAEFPQFNFFNSGMSIPENFQEIAYEVARHFVSDLSSSELQAIVVDAFNFSAPLTKLDEANYILELFHGPTLAFKDFGARFLARVLKKYVEFETKKVVILVATSGDTGSAVASGFFGMDGVEVGLLYPSGMVSKIQEQQLTTMGGNIHAFEVHGTFDDCQNLVKKAFPDPDLRTAFYLSSANSINIARLLPQSFYYIYAAGQLDKSDNMPVFCVPSGNFGNLTAGIFAAKMGLQVARFIAAVNTNRVFADYLHSGRYQKSKAKKTLSNAMDVGDPSNFSRIADLFDGSLEAIRSHIWSDSVSDEDTLDMIRQCYEKYNYIIDPHGAVGLTSAHRYQKAFHSEYPVITLETAHPGKFADTVEQALSMQIELPPVLKKAMAKEKKAVPISNNYEDFKQVLLEMYI